MKIEMAWAPPIWPDQRDLLRSLTLELFKELIGKISIDNHHYSFYNGPGSYYGSEGLHLVLYDMEHRNTMNMNSGLVLSIYIHYPTQNITIKFYNNELTLNIYQPDFEKQINSFIHPHLHIKFKQDWGWDQLVYSWGADELITNEDIEQARADVEAILGQSSLPVVLP